MKTIMAVQKNKNKKKIKKVVKKVIKKKIAVKKVVKKLKTKKFQPLRLKKALHNPIIKPRLYTWESKATFNPSAFYSDGKIYIVYRAIGDDDLSVLGYASTKDGLNIDDRYPYSIFQRVQPNYKLGQIFFHSYLSGGGGNGGCEDPRLTLIGDTIYMIYVAFDGWGSVRMALTSIKLDDFTKNKWKWTKPVLISPPGEIHKNWVLFPEKINDKYAILHNISPTILIEYIDNLDEFDGNKFIKSISHAEKSCDVQKTGIRGVGPAPIKTKLGWLIFYHGTEKNDPGRYKLWAMILDEKDPTKILYRSSNPILAPEEYYENNGHKWGVVYSCGAVVKDKKLFVYYGGADKFVCVASILLDELLEDLRSGKPAKLEKEKLLKD